MLEHAFVGVLLITIANLNNSYGQNYQGNFWKSFSPGELLNKLDLMTVADVSNPKFSELQTVRTTTASTVTSAPVSEYYTTWKTVQNKSTSSPNKRIYTTDDNSAASASVETDDYEREYEQFVHNYFDDAANHYLSNDEENNESTEVANFSSDTSNENDSTAPLDAIPYSSTTKSNKKQTKKCRKVRRKREVCVICKNTRNGDRSETCTYKSGSDPKSYAYETQRKYRKTRERDNNDSEYDDEDIESKEIAAESKVHKKIVELEIEKSPLKNTCMENIVKDKDPIGEKKIICLGLNAQQKIGNQPKKEFKKNEDKHPKRKIYKRKLSYVYEKGLGSNESITKPKGFTSNADSLM